MGTRDQVKLARAAQSSGFIWRAYLWPVMLVLSQATSADAQTDAGKPGDLPPPAAIQPSLGQALQYAATPDQSLPESAAAVRLADLNGDGLLEIITVAQGGDLVVLLGGVSPLQVAYRSPLLRGCAFQSPGLAIADLDGDGLLDVAVNGTGGFLLGGRTSFTPGFVTGVAPCFGGQAVVAADLNRDGAVDLAWLVGGTLTVIENAGAATFAAGQASFVSLPSTTTKLSPLAPRHTPLLDLNADGVPDIVVGDGVLSRASH